MPENRRGPTNCILASLSGDSQAKWPGLHYEKHPPRKCCGDKGPTKLKVTRTLAAGGGWHLSVAPVELEPHLPILEGFSASALEMLLNPPSSC